MAERNPRTNFMDEALFFFQGQINQSEDKEIENYKKENILDYVQSNICYELVQSLKVTKEEWLGMVQDYEREFKAKLHSLKRCFPVAKFNTIMQNDFGNDVNGCKDFFVYFFFWVKDKQTEEINYIISGVRVKYSALKETKGWFYDGEKISYKITKYFLHCVAKETINKLKGGEM